jgi:hypothetical protein
VRSFCSQPECSFIRDLWGGALMLAREPSVITQSMDR